MKWIIDELYNNASEEDKKKIAEAMIKAIKKGQAD